MRTALLLRSLRRHWKTISAADPRAKKRINRDGNMEGFRWVPMLDEHLDAVAALEHKAYGGDGLFEGRDIYAQRLHAFPDHMFVLVDADGAVVGHAVTLPIHRGHPPLLGESVQALGPDAADVVHYLLDIALLPQARGKGYVSKLLQLLPKDRDWELIAVHGTHEGEGSPLTVWAASAQLISLQQGIWKHNGFVPATCNKDLAAYGPEAVYMRRPARPE